jgi:hypothetical protein
MSTEDLKYLEGEKLKFEIEKIKAETQRIIADKEKLDSEKEQSQVPYWRRPAYLSIFIPAAIGLVIAFLNFSKLRDDARDEQLKELKHANEILETKKLDAERKEINEGRNKAIEDKKIAENEKIRIEGEKLKIEKEKVLLMAQFKKSQQQFEFQRAQMIAEAEQKLLSLKGENDGLQMSIGKLKNELANTTSGSEALIAEIRVRKASLDQLNNDFNALDSKSKMLSLLSSRLKSFLVRCYTNWNKNVPAGESAQLREDLGQIAAELELQFKAIPGAEKYFAEYNKLSESIKALLNDKSAFKKYKIQKNTSYVEAIDANTDKLVKLLQTSSLSGYSQNTNQP